MWGTVAKDKKNELDTTINELNKSKENLKNAYKVIDSIRGYVEKSKDILKENIDTLHALNGTIRDIIDRTLYTSNRTLDTTTKTIAEVKKIKTPPVEPYLDLTSDPTVKINPYVDFRNDSAIFTISIQNFKDSPAKNIKFTCVFINPQENDFYLGELVPVNRNTTLKKDEIIDLPFASYIPRKMPNAFYIYIKITYTNLKDSLQQPFERAYLRNAILGGKQAFNVSEHDFEATRHNVFVKYPYLR